MTYLCLAQGFKLQCCLYSFVAKPAVQNFLTNQRWRKMSVAFLNIFVSYILGAFLVYRKICGPQFIAPWRQCQVNSLTTVLKVNKWLRSGLQRNSCDANAKSSKPQSGLVKPWAIHNHSGRYAMMEFSIRGRSQLCVCPSIFVSISLCLWLFRQPLSHTLLTLFCDATHHSNYF